MKLSHRISGVMVATGLLIGGSVVMAAPAQAASYMSPLYPTKDQCVGGELVEGARPDPPGLQAQRRNGLREGHSRRRHRLAVLDPIRMSQTPRRRTE